MYLSPKVIAFSKALRLIDGCTSLMHFDAAGRYIELFGNMYVNYNVRKDKQLVEVLNMKLRERKRLL
jgi:hypothetical protein